MTNFPVAFSNDPLSSIIEMRYYPGFGFCVRANPGQAAAIFMQIDTGMEDSLMLNPRDWKTAFPSAPKTIQSKFVDATGAMFTGEIARLPRFKIGNQVYTNLLCRRAANPQAIATLGAGFLKRHVAILDFPNYKLVLLRSTADSADESNMSGLHFEWETRDLVVINLDEKSPAEEADIRVADRIKEINGRPLSKMTQRETSAIWTAGDGQIVFLQIERRGIRMEKRLKLKRMI